MEPRSVDPKGIRPGDRVLRRMAADRGIEVTVSDYRPGMVAPEGFADVAMECPHGIRMWMEPTIEQRAQWIAEAAR